MNIAKFVAFAMFFMACSAHMNIQDVSPQYYCGRSLARAIAIICYEDNFDKRSEGSMSNAIMSPYYKEQEGQYGWPWVAPRKARSMSLPGRGKRLVVNECCDKACSVNELLSYC